MKHPLLLLTVLLITASMAFGQVSSTDGTFSASGTTNLSLRTNTTPRLTILGSGTNIGFVGINKTTPIYQLDVNGTINATAALVRNTSNGTAAFAELTMFNDISKFGRLFFTSSTFSASPNIRANTAGIYSGGSGGISFVVDDPAAPISFSTSNSYKMIINPVGNVGIGTATPSNRLEISGSTFNRVSAIVNADVQTGFQTKKTGANATDWEMYVPAGSTDFRFFNGADLLTLKPNGNVGIGTTTPNSKLAVKGDIHAQEIKVVINVPGPDYVFEPTYDLRPLAEIEAYIKENKHLPEVPSAKEMEANGVKLGEMNMLLLKKVEELTLHLIKADAKNAEYGERIKALEEIVSNKK
jgi:hypothetical protein